MTRAPLLDLLLPSAPPFIVFGITPEREAAQCHLAAHLIHAGCSIGDITAHRYAFSLGLASGDDDQVTYVHYFETPDGHLLPIVTRHTPGVDDLGGLVPPSRS